jgi:hypothetical protein
MAVMPGGFHQDAAEMSVAGFGDGAARLFGATRVFRWHEPGERHHPRCGREAAGVTEFGGDGQRRQIVDAAETAQAFDAAAERLDREQIAELGVHRLKATAGFVDGADIRAMRLLESGQGPTLGLQPRGVPCRPRLLGGREAAAMAEEELREAVPGAQQVGTNVLAAAKEVACRLFLLGGNVNRGERAGTIGIASWPASRRSVFTRSPARRGINDGAMTSHGIPCAVNARCSSNPHGPAS